MLQSRNQDNNPLSSPKKEAVPAKRDDPGQVEGGENAPQKMTMKAYHEMVDRARNGDLATAEKVRYLEQLNSMPPAVIFDLSDDTIRFFIQRIAKLDMLRRLSLTEQVDQLAKQLLSEGPGTTSDTMLVKQVIMAYLEMIAHHDEQVKNFPLQISSVTIKNKLLDSVTGRFHKLLKLLVDTREKTKPKLTPLQPKVSVSKSKPKKQPQITEVKTTPLVHSPEEKRPALPRKRQPGNPDSCG